MTLLLKKWEEELTITLQDIIDNFWILPKYIGQGLGRKMFNHLIQTAKKRKIKYIKIISDPNAEGFYLKMGGKRIGENESSIKGRMLPKLEFKVNRSSFNPLITRFR